MKNLIDLYYDQEPNEYNSSGAFKSVLIFDRYVIKQVKDDCDSGSYYKISESDARDNSYYYDEEGNFHYEWATYERDMDDSPSYEESMSELENEFDYINSKKHLSIFVPILDGTAERYIMPKVKTYYDLLDNKKYASRINSNKLLAYRSAKIKKIAFNRFRDHRIYFSKNDIKYARLRGIIELGIMAGMSDVRIAADVYWFILEDKKTGLLGDMHDGNIGVYRGHIVTFDAGQTHYLGRSHSMRKKYNLKRYSSSTKSDLNQTIELHNHEEYYKYRAYQLSKTKLHFKNGRKDFEGIIKEISHHWKSGLFLTISKLDNTLEYVDLEELETKPI